MEWSKIKNIILLILVMVNLFLLGLVLYQGNQFRDASEIHKEVASVLERNGIQLDAGILPQDNGLYVLQTSRDLNLEAKLAAALLGEVTQEVLGGNVHAYTGEAGIMYFRSNGEFLVRWTAGGLAADLREGYESHALSILTLLQVGADTKSIQVISQDDKVRVTAGQTIYQAPIFNCDAVLLYEKDRLVSLSGYLFANVTAAKGSPVTMSAATALLRFLGWIHEQGYICKEISQVASGYEYSAGFSEPSVLTPIWFIETDTGTYYVNVASGEIEKTE